MAAGFGAQANALLRKSATYQKRNVSTNVCLLSSPIFFCLLLLFIKVLVDKVVLKGDQYECGCQCTKCCKDNVCTSLQQGFCDKDKDYVCQSTNKDACGLAFSSPSQATWCEVKDPSIWPPLAPIPARKYRARPASPAITTLVTSPNAAPFTVSAMTPNIYTVPITMDNETFLNDFLPELVTVNGTVNGYLFTQYGYTFGTTGGGGISQYIDNAFTSGQLALLLPPSGPLTCSMVMGVAGRDPNSPPPTNTSLPPPDTAALIAVLMSVVAVTSGTVVDVSQVYSALGNRPVLGGFLRRDTKCVDVVFNAEPSAAALDNTVYCGFKQARCNGSSVINEYPQAYGFEPAAPDTLSMSLSYNSTDSASTGQDYLRLNLGISSGVAAWVSGVLGPDNPLTYGVRLLGTMAMPKHASKLKLDLSNLLGPLFYTWVVQMLLPTFLQLLVYEKEKRLRMMMKMHGLGDGAYWLVTYLWYLMLYIIYMLIFVIFGAGVGLEIFRRTSIGIQVIFYFLFGNNMIALSFMVSSFFSSSRTATVVAFIYVFATGLIGELLLKVFMQKDATWVFFIQWIPAFALYRGLWEMAEYAFLGVYRGETGLTFARLSDAGCGMKATWAIFVVEWVIFMVLGWYFEQVLSSGTGIRRHPLFFLNKCRSRPKAVDARSPRSSVELTAGGGGGKAGDSTLTPGEREDVRAERLRVEAMGEAEIQATPIVVRDLRKVYPPLDGGKPKVAVRTLTLGIERGECFGLLGPNGAGKSTSINMLTGFLEPTSGSALIQGYDINTQMGKIYRLMGVCPQHDLLWEQLTGEEHLLFYGRLKGLKGADLTNAVAAALRSVNLQSGGVGQKQSQKYSGGMKRRLSVAVSFIGNPQVVYLDEPSTGLDPASRRNLWDVVRNNKDGRAIILTTHSMEEAEILCDRLGIFVDGQLVCVGNPREITSRYAGYLVFTITVGPGHEDAARALVGHMSPNARMTYALGTTLKYELPTSDVSLAGVFAAMASASSTIKVLDWGVANATLEEVFIKFARQIGAETQDQ